MQPNIFNIAPFDEIALLLGITAIAGAIAVRLRQPVLMTFIIIGIMVGPTGFQLIQTIQTEKKTS